MLRRNNNQLPTLSYYNIPSQIRVQALTGRRARRRLKNTMIKELAEIDIKPGSEQAFEEAALEARKLFLGSKGCLAFRLHRSMEQPSRYRLFVEWETIEDHMIEFRNSEAFLTWRQLCGPYFLNPPRVEHLVIVVEGRNTQGIKTSALATTSS